MATGDAWAGFVLEILRADPSLNPIVLEKVVREMLPGSIDEVKRWLAAIERARQGDKTVKIPETPARIAKVPRTNPPPSLKPDGELVKVASQLVVWRDGNRDMHLTLAGDPKPDVFDGLALLAHAEKSLHRMWTNLFVDQERAEAARQAAAKVRNGDE